MLNSTTQTILTIAVFLFLVYIQTNKRTTQGLTPEITQQLKGLGFCMVLCAHIGYFLFPGSEYLFPLSIWAGIGVNMFLFLSGFGLAKQVEKKQEPIFTFYKKRFLKIYIPLWIGTLILLLCSWLQGISWSLSQILPSLTGIVTSANIYSDFNSPLWFITLLLFFYGTFPLFYNSNKRIQTTLTTIGIAFVVFYGSSLLPIDVGVQVLYETHAFAFSLGVLCAMWSGYTPIKEYIKKLFTRIPHKVQKSIPYGGGILAWYGALHAGIGTPYEQWISLATMLAIIGSIMMTQRISSFLLDIGTYSYEAYIIHWPLLLWTSVLYVYISPWIATYVYITAYLVIGIGMHRIQRYIFKQKNA